MSVVAKYAIVARLPSLAGAIEYDPSLPANRAQVMQHWPQGVVIKTAFVYDTPFWQDRVLSSTSVDYTSLVAVTADSGTPEHYSKVGLLTALHICR